MFISALVTTALMEFSQVGVGLVDGIITAKFLGTNEIAAVGLSFPYFGICGVASGCFAAGLRSRCTKELGQGNIKKLNSLFSQSVTDGKLVLRFRDTSEQLNVKRLAEAMSKDTCAENIGLKMITSAADDIQYYRTLEPNNTLIMLKI